MAEIFDGMEWSFDAVGVRRSAAKYYPHFRCFRFVGTCMGSVLGLTLVSVGMREHSWLDANIATKELIPIVIAVAMWGRHWTV